VKQIQEDLPQEKADNEVEPEKKKAALKAILADYNTRFGTNHTIASSTSTIRMCRSASKTSSGPMPTTRQGRRKIDITIVVDMLLTGFDSKYLNTLYVDKNLKHHGLIQAFSRTNRVLNGTKPYGNILDFRQQQDAVDAAIALFSGEKSRRPSPRNLAGGQGPRRHRETQAAVQKLDAFMTSQGLDCAPEAVPNLKGDAARAAFINHFKEVQRLKTQLDQYTDLTDDNAATIEQILPKENLLSFRGAYLETAQLLKGPAGQGRRSARAGRGPARLRVRPLCLRPH
jgi:type I restriction enzyme R subunit